MKTPRHWTLGAGYLARRADGHARSCVRRFAGVIISAIVAVAAIGYPTNAQARHIQLADLRRIVSLSDPQISPDGKRIVFIVSRTNYAKDRYDTSLQLIEIQTRQTRQLTYDREGIGSPRWSPQGDRLGFVALTGSGKDAAQQIFIMPLNGGDAKQITHDKNGVQQFEWRPDGKEIAYVTADEPIDKKAIEKHNDAFEVGDNSYLTTAAPTPSHLWLVASDGGRERRLTRGSWSLPSSEPPSPPGSPLSWSPDGKYIAITRQPNAEYGDSDLSDVEIVDAISGATRKLTNHNRLEGFPLFSPDGSKIAYWYPREGDPANINAIYVSSASGGGGEDVTHALDRHIVRAMWMPDGKTLLVAAHEETRSALWLQPLDGAARPIDTGDVNASQFFWLDAALGRDGALAFTGSSPHHPSELYYLSHAGAALRRLTYFNAQIAALDLGKVESLRWTGPNGFEENGVLTYPPDYVAGRKYPLVLVIHGGPSSASITSFGGLSQLLAARGYLVFQPNYRGSDNMGNAYWRAIFNDAGVGPGKDVMAGVEAVKKMGIVDESRMAVSGWSYGGYMTSWMIGHYPIWKAAVSGAAVNNLVDEYDLSDNNVTGRYGFPGTGSPWTSGGAQRYLEQSPISYAQNITAPTLIMSDTGDERVPITQSYEMFHALRDNHRTVSFIAYPVAGHFPGDPVRSEDVYRRWIAWIARYLR
ncbi:MAG: S9 family peptidase [Candidatus Eremiobacteraeota bacterium]|nr:S9 family peptidase [Candidatus Eremiobacteraeota bacterium]MBC5827141.1 S9 family peptidase [Candidatus Eremiobacteraeota bacterium]